MRRTKIVCTIGPSSSDPDVMLKLVEAGMNVARLNFSHGTHDMHRENYKKLREIAEKTGHNVAIMMDLQGPKIRTGTLADGEPLNLIVDEKICITTDDIEGTKDRISTSYVHLPDDVIEGDRILLVDGTLEFRVERVEKPDVYCRVVRGGILGEHKGINLPGVAVSAPSLGEKDKEDLKFGLELGVDYVALSFVRSASDIRETKKIIEDAGSGAQVVAKIERPEAVESFDEILEVTDAVMVARGDLGVEVDVETVPQIQKELIAKCNMKGVPVITATQMLESMVLCAMPTRAEVTDVANAIYDGTDAVMLSGETAAGMYPVHAARMMSQIAEAADEAIAATVTSTLELRRRKAKTPKGSFSNAIGRAVCDIGRDLDAKHIVCFTYSGSTARAIARYRPATPIAAITLSAETRRRCAMYWGVKAVKSVEVNDTDALVGVVNEILLEHGLAEKGDTVIIVAGTPLAVGGHTNLLKLHYLGDPA